MLCVCSVISSRYIAQTTEVVLNISTVRDDNNTFFADKVKGHHSYEL